MNQDAEHLRLLSIGHYVLGGLAALFSLFPLLHLFLGLGLATGRIEESDPAAAMVGWFLVALACGLILLGVTYAVCVIVAGRKLARRQGYTFCLVMAAISCAFAPFGTVLGVLTILVLVRDPVKAMFGVRAEPLGSDE